MHMDLPEESANTWSFQKNLKPSMYNNVMASLVQAQLPTHILLTGTDMHNNK